MCLKEIEVHAENKIIILGCEVKHNGGNIGKHLMSMRIFHFENELDNDTSSKNYKLNG